MKTCEITIKIKVEVPDKKAAWKLGQLACEHLCAVEQFAHSNVETVGEVEK